MLTIPAILFAFSLPVFATERPGVLIPRGVYEPFFRDQGEKEIPVGPFLIDRDSVTNAEFREFLKTHPQWRRSRIKKIFAEPAYLARWTGDTAFPPTMADWPVTNVSWFVARKFCEAQGRRLPTLAEWEYAADSRNPDHLQAVLEWYANPNAVLKNVRDLKTNAFGVRGMHGNVWEWVEDFSTVIMAGDSRSSNETDRKMFCGAGSLRAKDPAQYATFMRFAHRSSLSANMTGETLGFRCVREINSPKGTRK